MAAWSGGTRLDMKPSLATARGSGQRSRIGYARIPRMPSAFLDRKSPPSQRELPHVLGQAAPLWEELLERLAEVHAPLTQSWSYSGKSHGWLLKLQRRGKTLAYLIPCEGFLVASFALREPAHAAALAQKWPAAVQKQLAGAPAFAEGRSVKLEVRRKADLAAVLKLVALKLAN